MDIAGIDAELEHAAADIAAARASLAAIRPRYGDGSPHDRWQYLNGMEGDAVEHMDRDLLLRAPKVVVTTPVELFAATNGLRLAQLNDPTASAWVVVDPEVMPALAPMPADWHIVADNLVLDLVARPPTLLPGGTPGPKGVGTPGRGVYIGGASHADMVANGGPTHNVAIDGLCYAGNWGGGVDTKDCAYVRWWARGIYLSHVDLTNVDPMTHDGGLDVSYGATGITVADSFLHEHYKLAYVSGASPPDGLWPPGYSAAAPGPYTLGWRWPSGPAVRVSWVRCWFRNIGYRAPMIATTNLDAFTHVLNCLVEGQGWYFANPEGPNNDINVFPWQPGFDGPPASGRRNKGNGLIARKGGVLEVEGTVVIRPPAASSSAAMAIENEVNSAIVNEHDNLFVNSPTLSGDCHMALPVAAPAHVAQLATLELAADLRARCGLAGLTLFP